MRFSQCAYFFSAFSFPRLPVATKRKLFRAQGDGGSGCFWGAPNLSYREIDGLVATRTHRGRERSAICSEKSVPECKKPAESPPAGKCTI